MEEGETEKLANRNAGTVERNVGIAERVNLSSAPSNSIFHSFNVSAIPTFRPAIIPRLVRRKNEEIMPHTTFLLARAPATRLRNSFYCRAIAMRTASCGDTR